MSTHGGTKAVLAALVANAFIAAMKFGAWALTGAASMLAEGVHSVADVYKRQAPGLPAAAHRGR